MRVSTVYVDARTELAHRRLLAAGQSDIDYRLAEELLRLLSAALRNAAQRTADARRVRPVRPPAGGAGAGGHP